MAVDVADGVVGALRERFRAMAARAAHDAEQFLVSRVAVQLTHMRASVQRVVLQHTVAPMLSLRAPDPPTPEFALHVLRVVSRAAPLRDGHADIQRVVVPLLEGAGEAWGGSDSRGRARMAKVRADVTRAVADELLPLCHDHVLGVLERVLPLLQPETRTWCTAALVRPLTASSEAARALCAATMPTATLPAPPTPPRRVHAHVTELVRGATRALREGDAALATRLLLQSREPPPHGSHVVAMSRVECVACVGAVGGVLATCTRHTLTEPTAAQQAHHAHDIVALAALRVLRGLGDAVPAPVAALCLHTHVAPLAVYYVRGLRAVGAQRIPMWHTAARMCVLLLTSAPLCRAWTTTQLEGTLGVLWGALTHHSAQHGGVLGAAPATAALSWGKQPAWAQSVVVSFVRFACQLRAQGDDALAAWVAARVAPLFERVDAADHDAAALRWALERAAPP